MYLCDRLTTEVGTTPAFKAFRTYVEKLGELRAWLIRTAVRGPRLTAGSPLLSPISDTLKIYTRAHGSKTTNLIINLDRPEWVLDSNKDETLASLHLGECKDWLEVFAAYVCGHADLDVVSPI